MESFIEVVKSENEERDSLDKDLEEKKISEDLHKIKMDVLEYKTRYDLYLSLNNYA